MTVKEIIHGDVRYDKNGYKQNNPNSSLSDKIAYVASYYKIAKPLASHYLIALHES